MMNYLLVVLWGGDEKEQPSCGDSSSSDDSEYEIDKFSYLANKLHYDDENKAVYKTTKVVEEGGFIVAYRKRRYPNGKFAMKEEKRPIFAKDVVEYTKAYDKMQPK